MVSPGPPAPGRRFEILVIVGIMACLLMGALDNFVVLTALPNILADFHEPSTSSTSVVSAYLIASTIAIPIFAKLSDLWSRRNVFVGGLVLFIAGSILSGLSQDLNQLIAFRAIQGFGSGGFFPVGIAIVAVTFPPETRARIIGLLSGVFGIATVAGPLLGNAIVSVTTWRWIFYVNIPIGFAGLLILLFTLPLLKPERVRPFDAIGAGLLAAWVATLMYGLLQVSYVGAAWTSTLVLTLLLVAAVLAVAFVFWELRAREPLVPIRLLRQRIVAASGGTTFLVGMVFFPLGTFLTALVIGTSTNPGQDSDIVRDMLYALVLPLVIGAALGGQLLVRLSYRTLVATGIGIAIVGFALLTQITAATPYWVLTYGFVPTGGLVLPLIPIGFGIGLTFPVFLLAVQNTVKQEDVGEAGGLMQFLQSLGGAIGLSVLASVATSRLGQLDPSPSSSCTTAMPAPSCVPFLLDYAQSVVDSYVLTFQIMIGLLLASLLFVFFFRGRLPRRSAVPEDGRTMPAPSLGARMAGPDPEEDAPP